MSSPSLKLSFDALLPKSGHMWSIWRYIQTILALGVGLWSLRYVLPNPPNVPGLESFRTQHFAFVVHTVSVSIALLLGPWQFYPRLRLGRPLIHRRIGRVYAVAIVIGWIASVPIAFNAHTGGVAMVAFLALGVSWLVCTVNGVRLASLKRFGLHREWMLRSYALTAAGITLRIYIGLSEAAHLPLSDTYPVIAWICWVPNLMLIEWLIRRERSRGTLILR